jgi:flagellin-specific chaperone FliS
MLPNNFFERVLELESLLDDNRSIELIQDLNELYRVVVR